MILASLGGAPASVTGLFSALALFRAPYILATGLAARLTGWLTQVAVEGRQLMVRRLMWLTVAGVVGLTPLAAVFGAIVGPDLVGLVFGSDVSLPSDLVGVVAAGSTVALGGLFSTLLLIAVGRGGAVIFPWVGALVVGFAWAILGPGPPLDRVTWAFLVAEVVAFVLMHLIVSWTGAYGRPEESAEQCGNKTSRRPRRGVPIYEQLNWLTQRACLAHSLWDRKDRQPCSIGAYAPMLNIVQPPSAFPMLWGNARWCGA